MLDVGLRRRLLPIRRQEGLEAIGLGDSRYGGTTSRSGRAVGARTSASGTMPGEYWLDPFELDETDDDDYDDYDDFDDLDADEWDIDYEDEYYNDSASDDPVEEAFVDMMDAFLL